MSEEETTTEITKEEAAAAKAVALDNARKARIRAELARMKGWPQALQMLGLLGGYPPGVPIPYGNLCSAAGVTDTKGRGYIALAKAYIEGVSGTKLRNLPGIGYWIAVGEKDKLDETLKECRRAVSHGNRMIKSVGLLDASKITSTEDVEIYGIVKGLTSTMQIMEKQFSETAHELVRNREAVARLAASTKETQIPLKDLIGVVEKPSDSVKRAIAKVDKVDDDSTDC